jgi:hypothetical protein
VAKAELAQSYMHQLQIDRLLVVITDRLMIMSDAGYWMLNAGYSILDV